WSSDVCSSDLRPSHDGTVESVQMRRNACGRRHDRRRENRLVSCLHEQIRVALAIKVRQKESTEHAVHYSRDQAKKVLSSFHSVLLEMVARDVSQTTLRQRLRFSSPDTSRSSGFHDCKKRR